MTKEDWIINIENTMSHLTKNQVLFVMGKYQLKSIYDLTPSEYSDIWNELDYMTSDN